MQRQVNLFQNKELPPIEVPKSGFNVIYADPPWPYNDKRGNSKKWGSATAHYQTISMDELKTLNINKIASKDCMLFLWSTAPMIPQALEVLYAWGFKYKTIGFVWVKTNMRKGNIFKGLGNYTQSNAEFVLLGKKGNIKRKSKKVPQVLIKERKQHSQKPTEIRDRIDELMGKDLPKIELFAREALDGNWQAWGDEIQ